MNTTQRVTISLPADLLQQIRQASDGNVSKLITDALREHFENERRRVLRESLIAGYQAHAEEALAMAEEFKYVDYETVIKYVPPSPELEISNAQELAEAR